MAHRRRRGIRHWFEGEDRQQFLISAMFATLIVLLVVILVGAVAINWYQQNLRPLARVGSVEILPSLARERARLLNTRLDFREGYLSEAITRREIDSATATTLAQNITQERNDIGTQAAEGLIDLIYQSQLAADEGITVSDEDVTQQQATELAGPERRHVLAVVVQPTAADESQQPTLADRKEALERAQAAQADLAAGQPFAEVADEYSTDESAPAGGDFGVISQLAIADPRFAQAVFDLPAEGTTDIVRGIDNVYRIGRVTQIEQPPEQPGARTRLLNGLSQERYDEFVRYEIAAQRLEQKVVDDAVAGTPEQLHLANIFIEGEATGEEEEDEGEVRFAEIVYAPGDDLQQTPDDANDPLWQAALDEAQATADELRAISDPEQRATRIAELASDESDAPSAEDAGEQVQTRDLAVPEVGDALFDEQHAANEIIGPIRGEAAYYVILFHERRESPDKRLQAARDAAEAAGADFAAVARQYSEGPDAADGGDMGWLTEDQLRPEIGAGVVNLQVGQLSPNIPGDALGETGQVVHGRYVFKLLGREERPLDLDQLGDVRDNAFAAWYADKKRTAERDGVISRTDQTPGELDIPPNG
jgi:parvulin-like peptidyl-prolyl isomerase